MLRISLPFKCLWQKPSRGLLSGPITVTPKHFEFAPLAMQVERNSMSAILLRPTLKSKSVINNRRNIHTDEGNTGGAEKGPEPAHSIYRNKYGEQIMFINSYPPPGYQFVPSGNIFITRNCRSLAQRVYPVYRPGNRKRGATQIGIYAPTEIYEKVQAEFTARRLQNIQGLRRDLARRFPKMPSADRKEMCRIISTEIPNTVGGDFMLETRIFQYIRDRYTRYKTLDQSKTASREEANQALLRARKILASWRK